MVQQAQCGQRRDAAAEAAKSGHSCANESTVPWFCLATKKSFVLSHVHMFRAVRDR